MKAMTTARVKLTRFANGDHGRGEDMVAIEEPLEIRVGERPISVTMRTPGDDEVLAAGFLFGESVISDRASIESIRHWGSPNVIRVSLRTGERIDWQRLQRNFYSTSSCGVCGKASIDALRVHAARVESTLLVPARSIEMMPDALHAAQRTFAETGGLHAAALFTAEGELVALREDVGRHNAVDKVVGEEFLAGRTPISDRLLFVSGRCSFEIVQKAVVAGLPVIAAISAPSSLAIDLAREFNVTLVGFVRDRRMNVYCGEERIG